MREPVVVRQIDRATQDVVNALAEAGVATVHEAAGRTGLMSPRIRPIQSGARIGGTAVTVLCPPGDNMMIHAAVEVTQPGDILVVATTSHTTDGMFGELLATSLQSRGCAGLVIEAGVRDVADLRRMNFPVWSAAIHAQGTVKATPGSVNVPIVCAGAQVRPGDAVVADDDGVVVIPRLDAAAVLGTARQRLSQEDQTRRRLEAGELGLEVYGLRQRLEDLGVRWVDTADETDH